MVMQGVVPNGEEPGYYNGSQIIFWLLVTCTYILVTVNSSMHIIFVLLYF